MRIIDIDAFYLLKTAAGRSPDHARCSHSNIFQLDVYKTLAKIAVPGYQILATNCWLPDLWLPDPGYQILATRSGIPDGGYHVPAIKSLLLQDPRHQIVVTRSGILGSGHHGPGYQILAARSWLQDPGYQIVATRSGIPDSCYHVYATRSWLPNPGTRFSLG